MATIYIDNPIEREFAMVPNALWRLGISLKAKGLFAFLLTFRDGSAPTVAEISDALSIGKDARQAAFRELERVKLAEWQVVRSADGRAIGRRMVITTRPLLVAAGRAAENPADGRRAPENPAVGKPALSGRETRPSEPENPAILKDRHTKARAVPPRPATARRSLPDGSGGPVPSEVTAPGFVRSCLLQGKPVVIGGRLLKPSDPEHGRLSALALTAERAERERPSPSVAPVAAGPVQ